MSLHSVLDNFDLVSFNPRGTGDNAVPCATPNFASILELNLDSDASVGALFDMSSADATTCKTARDALFRQNLATTVMVQDVDAIRVALGVKQINFVGYSYGTLLGALYLRTYPENVRSMVLDANLLPVSDYQRLLDTGTPATDDIMTRFFNECSTNDAGVNCAIASNPIGTFQQAIINGTAPSRISITGIPPSEFQPGSGFIRWMILGTIKVTRPSTPGDNHWFLNPPNTWPQIAAGIAQAAASNSADIFYQMLLGSGSDPGIPAPRDTGDLGNAVRCADYGNHYTSRDEVIKFARDRRNNYPLLGGYFFARSAVACVGWPSGENTQFGSIHLPDNHVPVLIISSAEDSDAAPAWSQAMHDAIGNSKLILWSGAGHTVYIGNEQPAHCVEDKVNDMLINLVLPVQHKSICNDFTHPFQLP